MKTVTPEQFKGFGPCWLEDAAGRERFASIAALRAEWTALDVLNLPNVSAADKLWSVLREEFIDAPILHEFACRCAEYALSFVDNPDPRSIAAIEAKRKWLRGEIKDEELRAAWAAARAAAWDAARAAARAAAMAATWDAVRDSAWDSAGAAARAAAMAATWDAAGAAAWAAARAATWDAVRDSAWDSAGAAARAAAWDAAWAVARDAADAAASAAAMEHELEILRTLLTNEMPAGTTNPNEHM